MIETAENLARDYRISREAADAFAAAQPPARHRGLGRRPLRRRGGAGAACRSARAMRCRSTRDEGIRADTTMETLARLKPIMKDGTVTAGNASQQNDAAAACLVVAEDKLAELGLTPMGYLVGWAVAGCEPSHMGIGPVPAVAKLLKRSGLRFDQMDLIELNEAFACQALSVREGLGLSMDELDSRLNVNGSGISAGPPGGRHRRAHHDHAAARDAAPPGALRAGDDVHRRRPGHRRDLRARMT
jgi:acetyl-CoA C-acetyltransferase